MSDLENKKAEEAPKKRPYNLREKKEKKAAYRSLIRPELADELYDKILNIVVVQKKYKDPDYSAKDLAKELKTNTRYLSAVVNSRFGMNYSCLLNEYRVKDAAFVDRQALCRQECGRNQCNGWLCKSSIFLRCILQERR